MTKKIWIYFLTLTSALIILLTACKKEDNNDNPPPVIIVTDIDGNIYNTITNGTQVWMKENLKVTRYRNGNDIPNVTDSIAWSTLTTGAYCSYDNNTINANSYGYLYNWYAVSDSQNIAPTGWHVPSDDEWTTLIEYLGGSDVAGGKMKETGTNYWVDPNTGATNESGFTALPGGYRYSLDGMCYLLGKGGYWWSSTTADASDAWLSSVIYNNTHSPQYYYNKRHGYSIRCVLD